MLNDISRTPTFERDWKRLRRKHYDSAKLRKAIQTLMAEDADTLIHTYRDHSLKGEWAGFRELHIEGDWLLIRLRRNTPCFSYGDIRRLCLT